MISDKQMKILAFSYTNYDALICDGAVRSGKTSIMTVAFVDWAMNNFNGQRFGICGKTVGSAKQNIVVPFMTMYYAKRKYKIKWRGSDKIMEVTKGNTTNIFEVFGGKDEASFMLIQGRTLAGVLLDEVVLMPQSFVQQALTRCSVSGSKFWFSCNPGSPMHWFYNDWIKCANERNALYLHFTMKDNPSLNEKTLARYESIFEGVFYERYVLGRWVQAEGLVYANIFDESIHVSDEPLETVGAYYVSCDYGTQNATVFLLWHKLKDNKWLLEKEYYYSGRETNIQKTDEQYCDDLEAFLDGVSIKAIIVDPSAASFIAALKKRGYVVNKAKNDVIQGIRFTASVIKQNVIIIRSCCVNTIREFGLYVWNQDAAQDEVIKENDHAMDAFRYFCYTHLAANKAKALNHPIL